MNKKKTLLNNLKLEVNTVNILNLIIIIVCIYIIYRFYVFHKKLRNVNEGFTSSVNKLYKMSKDKNKFSFDLGNYGYTHHKNYTKNLKKKMKKKYNKGKEKFNSKVFQMSNSKSKGKHDNFQDVLDEIDMMDTSAFSFNSMNNTVKRYASNIDNRMLHAKKKNKGSKINSAWAQFRVILEEGGKLFSFSQII
tara:strand:- start:8283 stop:8858 length:576 start_codon:yes stop_codon:yes gene_type:complete